MMKGLLTSVSLLLLAVGAAGPHAIAGEKSHGGAPATFDPNRQGPGIVTGPGRVTPGYNCQSLCGSSCASASCSGLDVAQCIRVRQDCRVTCTSRC